MRNGAGRDVEPRDLPRVPEDARERMGLRDGKADPDAGWLEAGTEDPAFFIKPSEED